jgi:pilus assembly protein CpaE
MKHDKGLSWTRGRIRALIIAGPDTVSDWMASVINATADIVCMGLVRDLTQSLENVERLGPDVILVDISSGILNMGDVIATLSSSNSGTAVIVLAMGNELEAVRQAMLYGAQGFLLKPFSDSELLGSIRQAYELVTQRRAHLTLLPSPSVPGEAAPQRRATIVAVYSPKGGVGCSTIAVNLAVGLRTLTQKPVTLIDADLRFGDLDAILNILAGPSISALLNKLDELDDLFLEQTLVPHPSGVQVLTAPPYLDTADSVQAEDVKQIITRLATRHAGDVIVDTWSTLDEITLSILDSCDKLVMVTSAQMTALRDTHRFLEALALLHFDLNKILLVLNHPYQPGNVKPSDVERVLGRPIAQEIAYTPLQVASSLNRGVPLVQEYRDSAAAKNILSLAHHLADMIAAEQQPREQAEAAANGDPKRKKSKLFAWGQADMAKG